ncbi:tyrosinase family protein [Bradyrhizobium sp. I1.14.4]|uniref:tyrosinase family protein n=1 Tax=unclassified Bradyrhizobium TaxID=2631580 RepID=UPI003D1B0C9F
MNPPIAGDAGFLSSASSLDAVPVGKLDLVLKGDGSWTEFYVVGLKPSFGAKDVTIQAKRTDGTIVASNAIMVRVRKNAEKLSQLERNAFLRALASWKTKRGQARPTRYEDFYTAHADAFNLGIHSGFGQFVSNFLPWHRAFLLDFERELQEIDPTVSLPYWKFDAAAPKLFDQDFIGGLTPGSTEVQFSANNPIRGWSKAGQTIRRFKVFPDTAAVSAKNLDNILCLANPANCPNRAEKYRPTTDSFELNYHNNAHAAVLGWLGGADSPSDPLFFLLHANVDRGWAHWQAAYNRFTSNGADEASYAPTGQYPGAAANGRVRKGLYAMDEMWPWGKAATGTDEMATWLPHSFAFPASEGLPLTPDSPPFPAKMVDYLGKTNLENANGVCYDDIGFRGELLNN